MQDESRVKQVWTGQVGAMTVCMTVLTGSAGGPSRAQVLSSPAKSANTLSPHTNAALPKHTSNDHQSPHLRPGEAPAPPPRPSISASSFRSFIATIPFLSLTASLICPCVYYGNPLHGSTETESSEWERESSGGAGGGRPGLWKVTVEPT